MNFRRTHFRLHFLLLLSCFHLSGQAVATPGDAQVQGNNGVGGNNGGVMGEDLIIAQKKEQLRQAELAGDKPTAERLKKEIAGHETNKGAMKDAAAGCQKSADAAKAGDEGGAVPPAAPAPAKPPEKKEDPPATASAAPTTTPVPIATTTTPPAETTPNPMQQAILAETEKLKKETAASEAAARKPTSGGLATTATLAEIKANGDKVYAETVKAVGDAQKAQARQAPVPEPAPAPAPQKATMKDQLVSFDQRRKAGETMADVTAPRTNR